MAGWRRNAGLSGEEEEHWQPGREIEGMSSYRNSGEPRIEEVLADPIVHLVMQRDRLTPLDLMVVVDGARRGLKARSFQPDLGVLGE